ncbi:MAG TPA: type II toxin-antitoxin system RelE/ParE family toxin [Mesorhizobium sp.]|nr:type II toxin-antitoxin system RelE/ParE family toxin [Mesorhizobium sp.]
MWKVRIESHAEKDLSKLQKHDQRRILDFLETRLGRRDDPRELGAALQGPLAGLWKYRVGPFRLLARIDDGEITIWVVQIGNRREVYR